MCRVTEPCERAPDKSCTCEIQALFFGDALSAAAEMKRAATKAKTTSARRSTLFSTASSRKDSTHGLVVLSTHNEPPHAGWQASTETPPSEDGASFDYFVNAQRAQQIERREREEALQGAQSAANRGEKASFLASNVFAPLENAVLGLRMIPVRILLKANPANLETEELFLEVLKELWAEKRPGAAFPSVT